MGARLIAILAGFVLAGGTASAQPNPPESPRFEAPRGDRAGGWTGQTRSEVLARNVVATSHPAAAQAGLEILRAGGNAFDAAIAAAAVLNVVEPESAGIGGDVLMLAWSAKEQKLIGLNGIGRAPSGATLARYKAMENPRRVPYSGVHSVSVPGAVDGWDAILKRSGKLTFKEVLAPAVRVADGGFAVSERIGYDWASGAALLAKDPESARVYLPGGKAPAKYTLFRNPDLARAFRLLQEQGRDGFYKGDIGRAIVARSTALGGTMTLEDLSRTKADWVEPISTSYRGHQVYELPPSTQGFAVLEALNIVEACAPKLGVDLAALGQSSPQYWHLLVEAKKIAFDDLYRHNGDPDFSTIPVDRLISKAHAAAQCALIDMTKARAPDPAVDPIGGTVYVSTADAEGNMVSFIYSIYGDFGSGITVPGYGFVLNNRAAFFSLDEKSPNVIAPGKRPFHTLIPGLVMKDGQPLTVFGLMGGSQQVQGHLQVLVSMLDLEANPQAASDAARFSHTQSRNLLRLEGQLYQTVGSALEKLGHKVERADGRSMGGYQAIKRVSGQGEPAMYAGASDHRKDGLAAGE